MPLPSGGVYIRGRLWAAEEINILLDEWRSSVAETKAVQIERIRSALKLAGHDRTGPQIAAKIGNITNEFRLATSKNIPLSDEKQCHFEKLAEILGQVPLPVPSSPPPSSPPSPAPTIKDEHKESLKSLLEGTSGSPMPSFTELLGSSPLPVNPPTDITITGDPVIDFYLLIHYQETLEHQRRSELLRFVLTNYFANTRQQ